MCVKVANTSRILLASLLVLVLVNLSEQQFSYSANWGKRSAAAAPVALTQIASRQRMEMDCHSFIKIKQLLPESRIPSRLDALFKVFSYLLNSFIYYISTCFNRSTSTSRYQFCVELTSRTVWTS